MTAVVVLQKASRALWLKHRRAGLGGTDVAAVLGLSPWRTPLDVWIEKTGRGDTTDDGGSYATRRGQHLERFLLAEYAARHPGVILERPPALLAHPDLPWLRASLDHLAHWRDETRAVEAKTAGWRQRGDWWDDETLIPDSYAVQVLTYLAVTGLERCDTVADIAGDWIELTIMRDLAWEAETLPYLRVWWNRYVVADKPPPIDVDRDTIPALNRAWVPDPGESLGIPDDDPLHEDIRAARWTRGEISALSKDLDRARVRIRQAMGTASRITGPDMTVLARLDSRGVLTLPTPKEIPA